MTHDEMISMVYSHKHGRPVQFKWNNGWNDAGENHQFNFSNYEYRIKPEPKLRPWKPEEVPVGALLKYLDVVAVLSFKNELGFGFVSYSTTTKGNADARCWTYGRVYEEFISHSTDGGKTWKPCGVEE